MKKHVFLFLFFFGYFASNSQSKKSNLKVYTFEEVEKKHKENPKPIIVFIFTDWCNICHGMKSTTFKNIDIKNQLNDSFYLVMLNAETKKDIFFLGKKFTNKTGVHQLVKELTSKNRKISYPTSIILNSNFEIDLQLDGYIKSKKMKKILKLYLKLKS